MCRVITLCGSVEAVSRFAGEGVPISRHSFAFYEADMKEVTISDTDI